jgi:hypothetical protein
MNPIAEDTRMTSMICGLTWYIINPPIRIAIHLERIFDTPKKNRPMPIKITEPFPKELDQK